MKTFLDVALRALDIVLAQNPRRDLNGLNNINTICERYGSTFGSRTVRRMPLQGLSRRL